MLRKSASGPQGRAFGTGFGQELAAPQNTCKCGRGKGGGGQPPNRGVLGRIHGGFDQLSGPSVSTGSDRRPDHGRLFRFLSVNLFVGAIVSHSKESRDPSRCRHSFLGFKVDLRTGGVANWSPGRSGRYAAWFSSPPNICFRSPGVLAKATDMAWLPIPNELGSASVCFWFCAMSVVRVLVFTGRGPAITGARATDMA